MVVQSLSDAIKIYCRIKPSSKRKINYDIGEFETKGCSLKFTIPKDFTEGFVNNSREDYTFRFDGIFDQEARQDDVFDCIAKPVIENVLKGYNGTVFAYGQTGSGKTFTITGGPERYADRGIIPRALTYIFEKTQSDSKGCEYTIQISYLEIYNEAGYDLLDPQHEASKLEDLPRVSLMEDDQQNIHLKNLTMHASNNEEEALNLLFLGDTNRMIAETPMNQASTRSHCIFTIHLMARETSSAVVRRSKLHLVDLAGSERVAKTGVNGILLTEAKYINLSLHYLEQVIVALAEKNRTHIPYRNSMMTSVLRDSLGGNCMTSMVATCSVEKSNIGETLSTCRFAQRVALIKNTAVLNEELDPKLLVQRLKREVQLLRDELAAKTGERRTDQLTSDECDSVKQRVDTFVASHDPDSTLSLGADMRKIDFAFNYFKSRCLRHSKSFESEAQMGLPDASPHSHGQINFPDGNVTTVHLDNAEVKRLKEIIQQRDNEINILVNMLKKEKQRNATASKTLNTRSTSSDSGVAFGGEAHPSFTDAKYPKSNSAESIVSQPTRKQVLPPVGSLMSLEQTPHNGKQEEKIRRLVLGDMSTGREEAFEIYKRDSETSTRIEQQKHLLKHLYAKAKASGQEINDFRAKMNDLKANIHHISSQKAALGVANPNSDLSGLDNKEQGVRNEMEQTKIQYKAVYEKLKNMKTEIEHEQHILEMLKVRLLKQFEAWWAQQVEIVQAQQKDLNLVRSSRDSTSVQQSWDSLNRVAEANRTQTIIGRPPSGRKSSAGTTNISPIASTPATRMTDLLPASSSNCRVMAENDHLVNPRVSLQKSQSVEQLPFRQAPLVTGQTRTSSLSSSIQSNLDRKSTLPPSTQASHAIPLTGDPQVDADIMAFVRARQNVLKGQGVKKS